MFDFLKKYGRDVASIFHYTADTIEADGPMVVAALRTVGSLIPGISNVAAVAGAAIQDAEVIAAAVKRPPVVPVAAAAPAPVNPNPLRAAAAVAAVDAEIAAGAFAMPTDAPPAGAPPAAAPVLGSFVNPLRR